MFSGRKGHVNEKEAVLLSHDLVIAIYVAACGWTGLRGVASVGIVAVGFWLEGCCHSFVFTVFPDDVS